MTVFTSIADLVGHTPVLELAGLEKKLGLKAKIIAKLEAFNPAGSVKDRVAKAIIEDAEATGRLKPGATIYEPTSGNTGIGIAAIGHAKGYKVVITMPDSMSVERRSMIRAYGAEIVLTPGKDGMKGAIAKAEELHEKDPGSIVAGQFVNPANPKVHYESTGPEVFEQTGGAVDYFVAGVGTGGTLTGVGRYLKEKKPSVKVVAVEPASSPLLTQGKAGPHKIQGIGAGFIPKTLDTSVYDEVIDVENDAAFAAGKEVAATDAVLSGISAGAALWAAVEIAKRPEAAGKTIVVLFPDNADRYYSTPLYAAA
ncbi:MAG: cysteine synthase A [Mesosutterella sp.]|nr:cysteine synthase A [Mesosutterella sp.]